MPISRTIHSNFSTPNKELDIGRLVEAILLFDMTILADSTLLPQLIDTIGKEGINSLIAANLLSVDCSGGSGQGNLDYKQPGTFKNRPLDRPLRYGINTFWVQYSKSGKGSLEDRLRTILEESKNAGSIDDKELKDLQNNIFSSARIIDPQKLNSIDDFRDDIINKHNHIVELLLDDLAETHKIPVFTLDIRVKIEEVHDHIFQIDTNLSKLLGIADDELHELFKKRFFEINATNMRLRRMRDLEAICGLPEIYAKITAKRVDYISKLQAQSDTRPALTAILEIADVPTLAPGTTIDVDALIKLRESNEARAFRDWLQNRGSLDDRELEAMLGDWKNKTGNFLNQSIGKRLRWLASTGVGLASGDLTGIGANVLDEYLGRLLPGMGPIGFINNEYRKYIKRQT